MEQDKDTVSIKCLYKLHKYVLSFGTKIDDLEWPWVATRGHVNYFKAVKHYMANGAPY